MSENLSDAERLPNAPRKPIAVTAEEVLAWLNTENEPLLERRDALLAAAKRADKKLPTLRNDDDVNAVTKLIAQAAAVKKRAKAEFDRANDEFKPAIGAIRAWRNFVSDPLDEALAPLQKRQRDFLINRDAERRAEAQRQADAARKVAEDQQTAAFAAQDKGDDAGAAALFDVAEQAARVAQKSDAVVTRKGGAGKVKSDDGTSYLRSNVKFNVIDIDKVPDAYIIKTVDEKAVREATKIRDPATGLPRDPIPGLEFYLEHTAVTRAG